MIVTAILFFSPAWYSYYSVNLAMTESSFTSNSDTFYVGLFWEASGFTIYGTYSNLSDSMPLLNTCSSSAFSAAYTCYTWHVLQGLAVAYFILSGVKVTVSFAMLIFVHTDVSKIMDTGRILISMAAGIRFIFGVAMISTYWRSIASYKNYIVYLSPPPYVVHDWGMCVLLTYVNCLNDVVVVIVIWLSRLSSVEGMRISNSDEKQDISKDETIEPLKLKNDFGYRFGAKLSANRPRSTLMD